MNVLLKKKNSIEVLRVTVCQLSSFPSLKEHAGSLKGSVWTSHSLRQNMRGDKWLIRDQDLIGPTNAASLSREGAHAELLSSPRGRYVLKEPRANWETDWEGWDSERTKYLSLDYCYVSSAKQQSSCPGLKTVLVANHTRTAWNEVILHSNLCSYSIEELGNKSADVRTPMEISQLASVYSCSQNQPGQLHFKDTSCLDWLILRLTTHAVTF